MSEGGRGSGEGTAARLRAEALASERGLPVSEEQPLFIAPPLDLHAHRGVDSGFRAAIAEALVADPLGGAGREDPTGTTRTGTRGRAEARTVQDIDDVAELLPEEGEVTRFVELGVDTSNESTVVGENRLVLLQLLRSIGAVERAPTSLDGRPSKESILLGRERALRFRIALLDMWTEEAVSMVESGPLRPHALDALLQAALLVAFAHDPEPDPEALVGARDPELFGAVLYAIRDLWPHLARQAVRDAGAAACARVSVLGAARALDMLGNLALDLDDESLTATTLLVHHLGDLLGPPTAEMVAMVRRTLGR